MAKRSKTSRLIASKRSHSGSPGSGASIPEQALPQKASQSSLMWCAIVIV